MHIVNYMQIVISVIMNACMPIFLHWMKRRYYYITSYKIKGVLVEGKGGIVM